MVLDENVLARISRITVDDIKKCSRAFVENERRGYAYADALNEVQKNFGKPDEVCKGICGLLDAWHQSFYRFGPYDQAKILKAIERHHKELTSLQAKNIRDVELGDDFEAQVKPIFDSFLNATAGTNRRFTRRTVTGTSKSLSLLAPNLFPMVDEAISVAYDCWWVYSDFGFIEYTKFMRYMKVLAEQLVSQYSRIHGVTDLNRAEARLVKEVKTYSGDKYQYDESLLKTVDEYNYAKRTEGWC
jgi:hypothetical protein